MLRSLICLATALTTGFFSCASAQEWPSRPITMIIPFAAGGATDVLGRVMAEGMSKSLGQQVIVENVGGVGGGTGSLRVSRAEPDGYTFLLGTVGTHAQNQTLYKKPLYDAASDFQPVGLIAEIPLILISRKDLPASSLEEFIAFAKANQGKMTYGSAGIGSATHLGCVLLATTIGTKIQHVPYRGAAPAMQDLQGGRIDFMCDVVTTALAQIEAGSVKALATMTKVRSPVLPDLPTVSEKGFPEFEALTWNAFFLPKNTPAPIATKLHHAMTKAMDDPSVKDRLQTLGAILVASERRSPEHLAGFVRREIDKWGATIRSSGISVD
jgi:tripartite-type tricarboxylate transporter receptor subunit TctC